MWIGCLLHAPSRGLSCSPRMCPDQESYQRPLGAWVHAQPLSHARGAPRLSCVAAFSVGADTCPSPALLFCTNRRDNLNITRRPTPRRPSFAARPVFPRLPPPPGLCPRVFVFPPGAKPFFPCPGGRCPNRNRMRKRVPCLADGSALPH